MSNCGCKRSSCTSCYPSSCCQVAVPACPTPYYAQPSMCPEDHCRNIIQAAYAASVRVDNSFNMPDCDGSAQLKISGLIALTVGAYLWSPAVGYLEVIAFDSSTGIVTVQNNCEAGNAAAGTTFPACTLLVVSDPPQTSGSSPLSGIFVAIDFTAPGVGNCLLITVTGVTGLAVNKNVTIGSGTYRVSAINSATTITICNDGSGIAEGSPVVAKNGADQYQYPITPIDVNACTNDPVLQGAIIVCKDGISQPLDATSVGQVPVVVNAETNEVEFKTLDVPTRTCSTILCCLILTPGVLSYTIPVADSSQFTVGDKLQIGTRTDRFTVTSIPDATHIIATVDTDPGSITTIEEGTSICIQDCCENVQDNLDEFIEEILTPCNAELDAAVQRFALRTDVESEAITPVILNNANPNREGNQASLMITNNSTCRDMVGIVTFDFRWYGSFNLDAGSDVADVNDFTLQLRGAYTVGGNPSVFFSRREYITAQTGADRAQDFSMSRTDEFIIAPGGSITITATALIDYIDQTPGGATHHYDLTDAIARITLVGVSA